MKILIFLTPYFYPENFQINDFCFKLSESRRVVVITGIPNYKTLNFMRYKLFRPFKQKIKNLVIYRLPVIQERGWYYFNINFLLKFFNFLFSVLYGLFSFKRKN